MSAPTGQFLQQLQALADSYAAAQVAAAVAPLQQQLAQAQADLAAVQAKDTTDEATVASLQQQLATLQAQYNAYVVSHPDAPPPPPAVKVTEFADFTTQGAGMFLGKQSLTTPGVYRMTAKTSTKGGVVAGLAGGNTNQEYLIRAAGDSNSGPYPGLEFGNFELQGTDQGHLYNGMIVGYSTGAKIHDLKIDGIPGATSSPPGETFSLNLWHAQGAYLSKVSLDGRRVSDGQAVAASLLGYNYVGGTTTADDLTAQYAAFGFAVAMWQCTGAQVFNRGDFRFCRKAINIEQAIGGSYAFNACDFRGVTGAPYIAQISSIQASAKVVFTDPVVDAYPVKVRTFPGAAGNVQNDSDIRCVVGGVDVTADPTKFQILHAG